MVTARDLVEDIGRAGKGSKARTAGEKQKDRQADIDNIVLQGASPSTNRLSYDEVQDKYGHVQGWQDQLASTGYDVSTREGFDRYVRSDTARENRDRWLAEEERLAPLQFQSEVDAQGRKLQAKSDEEFQSSITSMQDDLTAVGQGTAESFQDAQNVATLAQRMWETDGDDAEEMRQQAAAILVTYKDQLAPHLPGTWYDDNFADLNEAMIAKDEGPGGAWNAAKGAVGDIAGGILGTVAHAGEQTASAIAGLAAIKQDSVSWQEGLKHAGTQALGAIDPSAYLAKLTPGLDWDGVAAMIPGADSNYIKLDDGRQYALDRNEDGYLNLREVMIKEADWKEGAWLSTTGSIEDLANLVYKAANPLSMVAEQAGLDVSGLTQQLDLAEDMGLGFIPGVSNDGQFRQFLQEDRMIDAIGVLDTVGLAVIDPTTYVGIGVAGRGVSALNTLRRSANPIARRAALRMSDDAVRLSQLPPLQQAAVRSANRDSLLDTLSALSRQEVESMARREGLTSPQFMAKYVKVAKDERKVFDLLLDHRLNKVERMMDNGAVPAFRFAGRRVIPLRRVWRAVGISHKATWVQKSKIWHKFDDVSESVNFMMEMDPSQITPAMRSQMRQTGEFFDTLADDPASALADVYNSSLDLDAAYGQARAIADALGVDTSKWDDIWAKVVDQEGKIGRYAPGPEGFRQAELIEGDDFARGNAGKGRIVDEEDWVYTNLETGYNIRHNELPPTSSLTPENAAERGYEAHRKMFPGEENKYKIQGTWDAAQSKSLPHGWKVEDGYRVKYVDDTDYAKRQLGGPEALNFGDIDEAFRQGPRTVDDLTPEQAARVKANMDIYNDPEEWVRSIDRRSLLGAARAATEGKDTPFPRWIGEKITRFSDRFSPRAGIKQELGVQAAVDADDSYAMAQAFGERSEDDLIRLGWDKKRGVSELNEAAKRESMEGLPWDSPQEAIGRILTKGEGEELFPDIAILREGGAQKTADLVERLDKIRTDIFNLNLLGEADMDAMLAHHGYMPRQNTKAAQDAAAVALDTNDTVRLEAFEKMGLVQREGGAGKWIPGGPDARIHQVGHLKGRSFHPEIEDIFELNEMAQKQLDQAGILEPGFKLYEDDAVTAWALRSRSAHEGAAIVDMFNGLSEITDTTGAKYVYMARAGRDEAETKANRLATDLRMKGEIGQQRFMEVPLPNGGYAHVNKVIYDDMMNTNRLLLRDSTQNGARKFAEEWNTVWGRYATSPLVGFGFHARNATGNIYNMILAGAKNPKVIGQAMEIQQKLDGIRNVMRNTGLSWNDALKHQDAPSLTAFQREVIDAARTHNIYSQGGRVADLTRATREDEDFLTPKTGVKNAFKDNRVLQTGQDFGTAVENNAKLGLLIDGMQTGMAPQEAAARVRKYLFDYSDLTAFESENMRMLNRFYTFTRKNTALQIKTLGTQPGRVVNANRLMDEWLRVWMGESDGTVGDADSEYLGAGRFLPPWAAQAHNIYGGGDMIGGLDTPFSSAMDTIDSLSSVASTPWHLVKIANSDDEEREAAMDAFQDNWRNALALTSGGPIEAVKTVSEYLSGVDSFTGASLSNKDDDWYDTLTRITDIAAPIGSKLVRFGEGSGMIGDEGDQKQYDEMWLNNLLGIQAMDLSDPANKQAQVDRFLSNAHWNLRGDVRGWEEATGEELATITELEELGRIDFRNRTVDFFLKSAFDPDFDWDDLSDEAQRALSVGMPKMFLEEYMGLDPIAIPKGEVGRLEAEQKSARSMQNMIDLAEAMGVEVTEEMRWEYSMLSTEGFTIKGAQETGVDPVYYDNKFNKGPAGESKYAERANAAMDIIEKVHGFDLREVRPLLTTREREVQQMQAEGWSKVEIQDWLFEDMSRQERTYFFGADMNEMEKYDRFDKEDVEKMQRRSWEAGGMWNVMNATFFGDGGAPGDFERFLAHRFMTNAEERELGYDPIRSPSRRDVRTSEEKAEDSENKWYAANSGGDYLASLGQ